MKKIIIKYFPFLGKYKRFLTALISSAAPAKSSYSQYGEDAFILSIAEKIRSDVSNDIYIDVGGNHPTDISNTYLFYRKGYRGIIIEPNKELIKLFSIFRKRDIALGIGCSEKATVLPFYISPTPVISSFKKSNENAADKKSYLPVLPLDSAIENIDIHDIFLLSIDVEGMNYEVLRGAVHTVSKCKIICVEFDDEGDKQRLLGVLSNNFDLIREIHCNLIFLNKKYVHLVEQA